VLVGYKFVGWVFFFQALTRSGAPWRSEMTLEVEGYRLEVKPTGGTGLRAPSTSWVLCLCSSSQQVAEDWKT
jgi:hypothetical protein